MNWNLVFEHRLADIQIFWSRIGGCLEGASWNFTANQESDFKLVDYSGPPNFALTLRFVEHLLSRKSLFALEGLLESGLLRCQAVPAGHDR